MIALLLLSLLQESATSAAPAAPPVPAPSDPAAVALLARLAAIQYAGGAARQVDGFDVQLVLRERGEQPQEFDFGLNYSRRAGERVAIQILDRNLGTEVKKGFDGSAYWLDTVNEAGKPVRQDLGGHEFEQDREAIDESIELAADLLLVLDLHSLSRQAEGLSLSNDVTKERLLSGSVHRGGSLWEFTIVLPEKDPAEGPQPQEIRLRQPNPDLLKAPEQPFLQDRSFRLGKFKRFRERSVPQEIQEYQPGMEAPSRILEIHDLRWADLLFSPPAPSPSPPK